MPSPSPPGHGTPAPVCWKQCTASCASTPRTSSAARAGPVLRTWSSEKWISLKSAEPKVCATPGIARKTSVTFSTLR